MNHCFRLDKAKPASSGPCQSRHNPVTSKVLLNRSNEPCGAEPRGVGSWNRAANAVRLEREADCAPRKVNDDCRHRRAEPDCDYRHRVGLAQRQQSRRVSRELVGRPQRRAALRNPLLRPHRGRRLRFRRACAIKNAKTSAAAPGPAASASIARTKPSPTPGSIGRTSTSRPSASMSA